MELEGVFTHNLKIEKLSLPERALVVITGPSGSGKSSLALDTIAVEGERRYLSALSLSQEVRIPPPPELKEARGIPPAVSLPQRIPPANPRSSLGTVSGLLEILRKLFAELGEVPCPGCQKPVRSTSTSQILTFFEDFPLGAKIQVLAPLREASPQALSYLVAEGFGRFVIDGQELDLTETPLPSTFEKASVVVDRLVKKENIGTRFLEALRLAEGLSGGPVEIKTPERSFFFTLKDRCPYCLAEIPVLRPEDFSFNHPRGVCTTCEGLGEVGEEPCPTCSGLRLKSQSLEVLIGPRKVSEILRLTLQELQKFFENLSFPGMYQKLFQSFQKRAIEILSTLVELGLGDLHLLSPFHQLSTGERKRVEIATLLSTHLSGCLFVLDEPSLGLSLPEKEKLLALLRKLAFAGNTVLLVEHDPLFIKASDLVVELGPGAGEAGGRVLFTGSPEELTRKPHLPTGAFLSGEKRLRRKTLPSQGKLTVICGPSGSGKTRILRKWAEELSNRGIPVLYVAGEIPGKVKGLVASFIGIFDEIRRLFAETPAARTLGLKPSHFSPFSSEGRCPLCKGEGRRSFRVPGLAETELLCEECGGTGLKPEALKVTYRGFTLPEILSLTVEEALHLFSRIPKIKETLFFLSANGLGYLRLGQSLRSLSGGEKLRLRLLRELLRPKTADYIFLDLPSMGLHLSDLEKLLVLFESLLKAGKKLVLAENHPVLILLADEIKFLEKGKARFEGSVWEFLKFDHPFVKGLQKYLSLVDLP